MAAEATATGPVSGATWPGGAGRRGPAAARGGGGGGVPPRPPHRLGRQLPFWRLKKKFSWRNRPEFSARLPAPCPPKCVAGKPRVWGYPGRVYFCGCRGTRGRGTWCVWGGRTQDTPLPEGPAGGGG